MNDVNVASRAASLGIRSVRAVVIDGKLVKTTRVGHENPPSTSGAISVSRSTAAVPQCIDVISVICDEFSCSTKFRCDDVGLAILLTHDVIASYGNSEVVAR